MRRLVILVVAAMAMFAFAPEIEAADATTAWNNYAASYNFPTVSGPFPSATFEQAYFGSDFETDFNSILSAVAHAMGTSIPPYTGEDAMGASIQNWPD